MRRKARGGGGEVREAERSWGKVAGPVSPYTCTGIYYNFVSRAKLLWRRSQQMLAEAEQRKELYIEL